MGRKKGTETILPPKIIKYRIQREKEKNRYPVLDSNKTKINDTKEPNNAHKNILKGEILQVITENFMEMLLDMVNQKVQKAFKKCQDTKNKEYKKTPK
jgi:hypothetical protein